jgi:signal transduction histidine kinase
LNGLKGSAGGTGLGLAISKSLIEGQGGTIISETEVGFGTTFSGFFRWQPEYPWFPQKVRIPG